MAYSYKDPATSRTRKRCSKCKEVKPGAEFYFHGETADRLFPSCKRCVCKYQAGLRLKRLEAANGTGR